jgi:hypothetical protein
MVSETLTATKLAPNKFGKLGRDGKDANGALVATNAPGSVIGGKVNGKASKTMPTVQPKTNRAQVNNS